MLVFIVRVRIVCGLAATSRSHVTSAVRCCSHPLGCRICMWLARCRSSLMSTESDLQGPDLCTSLRMHTHRWC